MAIVRAYGKPTLFITITATSDWDEIKNSLAPGEQSTDRPDIVARAFEQRVQALIDEIVKDKIFGTVIAHYGIEEWQKRGLPHFHWLATMHPDDVPKTPEDYDRIVSAEIPDKKKNPILYELVRKYMVHGPCNAKSPCCQNDKKECEKKFPKNYQTHTTVSENGAVTYRRKSPQEGGHTLMKQMKGENLPIKIGNQFIVPYNPYLLLRYRCHLNVEIVNTVKTTKYIHKYQHKGPDRSHAEIQDKNNEVKNFVQGRYFCSSQAAHHLLGFPLKRRYPPVLKLMFHLPDEQSVLFDDHDNIDVVLARGSRTMLTEFFRLNQEDEFARKILYPDLPRWYTWSDNTWKKRQKRTNSLYQATNDKDSPMSDTIGRIPTVALNPKTKELFMMRHLLYQVCIDF